MPLNLWFLVSGTLVLGLAAFHSLLGEQFLVRRLLRRLDLPHLFGDDSFTKLTLRYAWHLLSIVCAALAMILFYLAVRPAGPDTAPIARIVALAFLGAAIWCMVSTRTRHLSWIVLLAAGASAWAGTLGA